MVAELKPINLDTNVAEPEISFAQGEWFCAFTNPGCERRAEMDLASRGFRTFMPKLRRWVTHARVKRAVERPLMGRYLFVQVDHPRQSFASVRACNGVESLIGTNGVPAVIRASFVEAFMARYLAGEWDFCTQEPVRLIAGGGMRTNPRYPVGARVRVVSGEYDDLIATITQVKGNKIAVKLLEQAIYAHLTPLQVRPL